MEEATKKQMRTLEGFLQRPELEYNYLRDVDLKQIDKYQAKDLLSKCMEHEYPTQKQMKTLNDLAKIPEIYTEYLQDENLALLDKYEIGGLIYECLNYKRTQLGKADEKQMEINYEEPK